MEESKSTDKDDEEAIELDNSEKSSGKVCISRLSNHICFPISSYISLINLTCSNVVHDDKDNSIYHPMQEEMEEVGPSNCNEISKNDVFHNEPVQEASIKLCFHISGCFCSLCNG